MTDKPDWDLRHARYVAALHGFTLVPDDRVKRLRAEVIYPTFYLKEMGDKEREHFRSYQTRHLASLMANEVAKANHMEVAEYLIEPLFYEERRKLVAELTIITPKEPVNG